MRTINEQDDKGKIVVSSWKQDSDLNWNQIDSTNCQVGNVEETILDMQSDDLAACLDIGNITIEEVIGEALVGLGRMIDKIGLPTDKFVEQFEAALDTSNTDYFSEYILAIENVRDWQCLY